MARFLLAIGSSHPDGTQYIKRAIDKIREHRSFSVCGASRVYKNHSVATAHNSLFRNCVLSVRASLEPRALYRELLCIEAELGRIRSYRNARRTIDIDVLMSLEFYLSSANFSLPHREAFTRPFFVVPAIEALTRARWPIRSKLIESRSRFRLPLLIAESSNACIQYVEPNRATVC